MVVENVVVPDPRPVTCPTCGWEGEVHTYDIGDGREWCCPNCDMSHLDSPPERDEDGFTPAEVEMMKVVEHHSPGSEASMRAARRELLNP